MPPAEETTLTSSRLILRPFVDRDRAPFAAMNCNAEVMRYFPDKLSRQQSDELVDRIQAHFQLHGFGLWAVEVPKVASFIGFVGLLIPRFDAHFTPCVEVGWRLDPAHWGKGYATEAAAASLDFGFQNANEIISMTTVTNTPSRKVMERLGMSHDAADDFLHPLVPATSPIHPHVLYRLKKSAWEKHRTSLVS